MCTNFKTIPIVEQVQHNPLESELQLKAIFKYKSTLSMLTGSQRVIQIICTNSINCSGFVCMESRNREKYLVWNPLCSNAKLHSYKDYKYDYALKTNR